MKVVLTILFFYLSLCNAEGQVNYVLNPSLEIYDTCPWSADQICYAKYWSAIDSVSPWFAPKSSDGRPEYINTCDVNIDGTSAPINDRFYHYPRTGNGMAQVAMFYNVAEPAYVRDYLQGRLYKPLTGGKTYCVTFYVAQEQISSYSIKQIGVYLDGGNIDSTSLPGMPQTEYIPHLQVLNNSFITDTLNWVKIDGSFIANGTEKFITIGNFFDNAYTDTLSFNINSSLPGTAYYLVDDISVIESDTKAYAGTAVSKGSKDSIMLGRNEIIPGIKWWRDGLLIDTVHAGLWCRDSVPGMHTYKLSQTLCGVTTWDSVKVTVWPVGVTNISNNNQFSVFPNPSNGSFTISGKTNSKEATIEILNAFGQLVYKDVTEIQNEKLSKQINTGLPSGVYILRVKTNDQQRYLERLVIY